MLWYIIGGFVALAVTVFLVDAIIGAVRIRRSERELLQKLRDQ